MADILTLADGTPFALAGGGTLARTGQSPGPSVPAQSIGLGEGTREFVQINSNGPLTNNGGPITSVTINSVLQGTAGHFTTVSNGIRVTAAGENSLSGTYVLNCTFSNVNGSSTANITINITSNESHSHNGVTFDDLFTTMGNTGAGAPTKQINMPHVHKMFPGFTADAAIDANTFKNKNWGSEDRVTVESSDHDNMASTNYDFDINSVSGLTVQFIEFDFSGTRSGNPMVQVREAAVQSTNLVKIQDCYLHSTALDPTADYSSGYGGVGGIRTGAGDFGNMTVARNLITDVYVGIGTTTTTGAEQTCADNYIERCYTDLYNMDCEADSAGTSLFARNIGGLPAALGSDVGNPHADMIQFRTPSAPPVIAFQGLDVKHNIMFTGNSRVDGAQGFFADAGTEIHDAQFRANFYTGDNGKGIPWIEDSLNDIHVIGNTMVQWDPDAASMAAGPPKIYLGGNTGSGTAYYWSNIYGAAPTIANMTEDANDNVLLGASTSGTGVFYDYDEVFQGSLGGDFTKVEVGATTAGRDAVIATFSMLLNGPADIDSSGTKSTYDAGCFESGYAEFPDAILASAGATLDSSWETRV